MGTALPKIFYRIFGKREFKALIFGLDAAGKTTLVYKFQLGEVIATIPTIGINIQTLQLKKTKLTVWDFGSHQKLRPLIRHYYPGTKALIFVVDSCDRDRIYQARDELHKLLTEDELRDVPLLVMANKQDIAEFAMSVHQICDKLALNRIINRKWYLQGASAITGQGIVEGFQWLEKVIKQIQDEK